MSGSGPHAPPPPAAIGDDKNPEWIKTDFAHARPIADFPALARAFPVGGESRGIASAKTMVDPATAPARAAREKETDA